MCDIGFSYVGVFFIYLVFVIMIRYVRQVLIQKLNIFLGMYIRVIEYRVAEEFRGQMRYVEIVKR